LIKYIKSVLWRAAKCLFYIEEARCLKVKLALFTANLRKMQHIDSLEREPTDSTEIIFRTRNELKENSVQIKEFSSIKLRFYQSDLRLICSYSTTFNC